MEFGVPRCALDGATGAMSPPGRSQGEYRSAQRGGCLMSPPGRPKGECRSAKHRGCLMTGQTPR